MNTIMFYLSIPLVSHLFMNWFIFLFSFFCGSIVSFIYFIFFGSIKLKTYIVKFHNSFKSKDIY